MILLVLALLLQQSAVPPIRVMRGATLGADEVAQIGRLAQGQGAPWLVSPRPGMLGGIVWVVLRPDTSTPRVRRGRYLEMCAWRCDEPPRRIGSGPYEWHFDPSLPESVGQYAQVVIPGRDADDVRDATDPNRPFVVSGKFSDDELVSLVEFIRTSPRVSGNSSETVRGAAPISRIIGGLLETGTSVILELPEFYQTVVVSRSAGTWIVSHTSRMVY